MYNSHHRLEVTSLHRHAEKTFTLVSRWGGRISPEHVILERGSQPSFRVHIKKKTQIISKSPQIRRIHTPSTSLCQALQTQLTITTPHKHQTLLTQQLTNNPIIYETLSVSCGKRVRPGTERGGRSRLGSVREIADKCERCVIYRQYRLQSVKNYNAAIRSGLEVVASQEAQKAQ